MAVSANADILLFYFSWALRLPLISGVLRLPGVPATAAFLSCRLPRRLVRGPTGDLECDWEGCETDYIANAQRYFRKPAFSDPVRLAVGRALGERRVRVAWWLAKAQRADAGRRGAMRTLRGLLAGGSARVGAGLSTVLRSLVSGSRPVLAAAGVAVAAVSTALQQLLMLLSRLLRNGRRPPRPLAEGVD